MTETAVTTPNVDWDSVVAGGPAAPAAAPAAAPKAQNLPPIPPGMAVLIGRLPIKCDTGKAIVRLPEPIEGVKCAGVQASVGVSWDCYVPERKVCLPKPTGVAYARNDRAIVVELDGGDGVAEGLGWKADSTYPGALLKPRSVAFGVPYVTVWVWVGMPCGCDDEDWAPENEWG